MLTEVVASGGPIPGSPPPFLEGGARSHDEATISLALTQVLNLTFISNPVASSKAVKFEVSPQS